MAITLSQLLKRLLRKLEPCFFLWNLSSEFLPCLYKSTIRPCTDYCSHSRTGAANYFLDMMDKIPKRVCRAVAPTLGSPSKCGQCNIFDGWNFGRCSAELDDLVPVVYFLHSNNLHDFLSLFLDVLMIFMLLVSLLLHFSCRRFSFDSWCKSVYATLLCLCLLLTPYLVVAVHGFVKRILMKKKNINQKAS